MIASDVLQQAVPSGPHKMPKASASDPLRAAAKKIRSGVLGRDVEIHATGRK